MKHCFLFTYLFYCCLSFGYAQVDDVKSAFHELEKRREVLRQELQDSRPSSRADILKKGLQLGMWKELFPLIQKEEHLPADDRMLLLAQYYWLNNNFQLAESYVNQVLQHDPKHVGALKVKATLLIEAWRLQEAVDLCKALQEQYRDTEVALILGRALLLQRKYDEAHLIANKLQSSNPDLAAAYLLEADVYFWNQQPEKATPFIIKSLELDPFNADARFSYGYAIWRRVDATLLNQMAAQWDLALALNPLHFQTHWHWGNGHTNLTFVDYADPNETIIREKLETADSFVKQNKIQQALAVTKQAGKQFPESVLPSMHRASIYYSDFDSRTRKENLDSAQRIFQKILDKKPHYGPAHNGLSAVIKSKRIPYLNTYDSITSVLKHVKIDDLNSFISVFPDVAYYPGDLAKAMVWNQLYTSTVYFPFLAKQGNTFVIPPLHQDLAIAMKRPFFRFSTTFDNRQWMDIRGVGSGAAAIEYVERGAYQERNVILHEYVHLFHGRVLTDQENRRIRALYYQAMRENRTLDYYSRNNESEYLAQTYPAYFETVKVHPLDFKSMNTQSALIDKDPAMYSFLDSLVNKERRYLAGDKKAMATNWAEVYINLSKQTKDSIQAALLLDTALQFDKAYQPIYLAYADLMMRKKDWQQAYAYLHQAEDINPSYAPTYESYALLEANRMEELPIEKQQESLQKQVSFLKKAMQLEADYQNQAGLATTLRTLYHQQGKVGEAIQAADDYIETGADISTYLRDKKDEARVFAAAQRAMLGDKEQLPVLARIAGQKPQNFAIQLAYAEALSSQRLFNESNRQILKAQQLLASNRSRRPDFDLILADNYFSLGTVDSASFYLKQAMDNGSKLSPVERQQVIQLLTDLNRLDEAANWLENAGHLSSPYYSALRFYSEGSLQEKRGNLDSAIAHYKESLRHNPYFRKTFYRLIDLYRQQGNKSAAEQLTKEQNLLFIP
ncbi:tetratricopeptide repeat protein [Olivibacter sp. XZL3]|uniref:tetratricopeptide repeat protein n=1 Tax=Olivibacter sp. XZL3 TaxID=1735116 RepID=UPI00141707A0|nr:tetratricopeptide repeat protein [Olivibacter sp. XZL3]